MTLFIFFLAIVVFFYHYIYIFYLGLNTHCIIIIKNNLKLNKNGLSKIVIFDRRTQKTSHQK